MVMKKMVNYVLRFFIFGFLCLLGFHGYYFHAVVSFWIWA